MFSVTTRARSARPQALAIRWIASTTTRLRERSFEAALTLVARAVFAPNGLRTTLHTTQNTCHRTCDTQGITPTSVTIYSVVHAKLMVAHTRSLTRFAATLRSRAPRFRSSYVERNSRLSAANQPDQRYVRSTTAIITFQKQALVVSRGYRVAARGCPRCASMIAAVHAAVTRFGRRFLRCRWHCPPATPRGAPSPLMLPSPSVPHRRTRPAQSGRPRPFRPPQCVNGDGFHGPEHLPSGKEPFSGPSLIPAFGFCRSRVQLSRVPSLTAGVIRFELGSVRSPQPQPRLASRARRRSPDSATFQRETRAHQSNDPSSPEETLSLPSVLAPTEVESSREQHGTGTSSFRRKPQLIPRRYLPYRPRCGELAVRAATQRPTQATSRTPHCR